jgi:hypothetical protein
MHVIETVPVSDIYCSGMSRIETLPCGNVRLWCYAAQAADCGAGPVENVLVAKLVLPPSAVIPIMLMAVNVIGVDTPPALTEAVMAACAVVQH